MKTPEEIKRGLECGNCDGCPYARWDEKTGQFADHHCEFVETDALAYIQQLEREKEALIKVAHGQCRTCKHKLSFSQFDEPCCKCRNIWPGHGFESRWEWRGVEDEHA